MEEYKVGDSVLCLKPYSDNCMICKKIGTITVISDNLVCVEFDENIEGHIGSGIRNMNPIKVMDKIHKHLVQNCWNFPRDRFNIFLQVVSNYSVELI